MVDEIKVVQSAEHTPVITGRKRGRPRKDESHGSDPAGRKYQRSDQGPHSANIFIGQYVSGVLDGRFDAGYMLTVRVGNTGTVLRGVVFEPGRFVPVSAANDIAPHLPMVPRADVPIPGGGGSEIPNQNFHVKNKTSSSTTPSPGIYALPGDKVSVPPLTGTFVVPVTLNRAHPLPSPSIEASKKKTDNQPSPLVSAKSFITSENDSKNSSTHVEANVIPPSGSADAVGSLATSYSKKTEEASNEKLDAVANAIADHGNVHQAGLTPTSLEKEKKSSDNAAGSDNVDPGLSGADVNHNMD